MFSLDSYGPSFIWLPHFSLMVFYCCHYIFPTFWRRLFEMKLEGMIGSYQMGGKWTESCLSR